MEATQPVSLCSFLGRGGENGQIGREFGGLLGQLWSSQESWSGRPDTWILGSVPPSLCGHGQVNCLELSGTVFSAVKMEIMIHPSHASLKCFKNGMK